jgi:glutathionyl-hydroquinone reductase
VPRQILTFENSKYGLIATQPAYQTAVDNLFAHLDKVDEHLLSSSNAGPYYFGSQISEVDVVSVSPSSASIPST